MTTTVFAATMDTLDALSKDGGGGNYCSGKYTLTVANDPALNLKAFKATIETPSNPTSGVRLFRWRELRQNRTTFCSAQILIPTATKLTGQFWNLFQFKSRTRRDAPLYPGRNDPLWAIYVENKNGTLRPKLGWGWGGTQCSGPYATSTVGGKWYPMAGTIPVGRWFTLRAALTQSNQFDGSLAVWIDGVVSASLVGIRTSYENPDYNAWRCANEWAVCHYSDGLNPTPNTVWVDNMRIQIP